MIFDKLILNHNVWQKLSNAVNNNKVPNAFIFSGIDGLGKEAHAIEFSAFLNCKRVVEKKYPCGDCRSCIKIRSLNHQEIYLIHPSPPPKNKSDSNLDQRVIEEIHKNYKQKLQNPYHKIKIGNSKTIPIASIRSLKKKLFFSKSDENWSVVVISDAEKLCTQRAEAANSLLKILEEPPERTLFILISSNINLLIPTIQSRCQKIYFKEHSKSELKNYAEKHLKTDSIDEIIELSMGSIGQLVNTNSNTLNNVREVVDFFYDSNILSIEKLLIDGILIIEHNRKIDLTNQPNYYMKRRYGDSTISFFNSNIKKRQAYKPDSVQRLNLLDDHSSKVCITTNPIAAYPNLTPKQSRRPFQAFL